MKVYVSNLLICISFVTHATAQLPVSDWEVMNLKGKVKSVTDTFFVKIPHNARVYIKKIFFNEKGDILEDIFLTDFGSDTIRNIYDERGYLMEIRAKNITKFTYQFDSTGKMTEIRRFNNGKPYDRQVYKYGDSGKPAELDFYLTNPNTFKLWEWHYGPYSFKYDDKGNKIEEPRRNNDGWSFSPVKYTYDEKGNRIMMNLNNYDHHFKYDENGNQLERTIFKSNGKPLKEKDANGFTYEYDKNQNWIKKTGLLYGVETNLTLRSIVYY